MAMVMSLELLTDIVIDELVQDPDARTQAEQVAEDRRARLGLFRLPTPREAFNRLSATERQRTFIRSATLVSQANGWDWPTGLAAVLVRALRMGGGRCG